MHFPSEIWSKIAQDLPAQERVRLNAALEPSDRLPWTKIESQLGMIDYAMRNGTFVPSKEVIRFVGLYIDYKIAQSIWDRLDKNSLEARMVELEWAMTKGEFTEYDKYPTDYESLDFTCWYPLGKHLGKVSVQSFENFKATKMFNQILSDGHARKCFMEGCNPVLFEHVLNEISEGRLPWVPLSSSTLITNDAIRCLKEANLPDERWPNILKVAIASGKFGVADMIMADGYRLDGPRIIKPQAKTVKVVEVEADEVAKLFGKLNDDINIMIESSRAARNARKLTFAVVSSVVFVGFVIFYLRL